MTAEQYERQMFVRTETRYTIVGTLVGAYWWPIGHEWTMPVHQTFVRADVVDIDRLHDYGSTRSQRARSMLDAISLEHGGDSSSGVRLTADSTLTIQREMTLTHWRRSAGSGATTYTMTRTIELARMPSLSDYVDARASYELADEQDEDEEQD